MFADAPGWSRIPAIQCWVFKSQNTRRREVRRSDYWKRRHARVLDKARGKRSEREASRQAWGKHPERAALHKVRGTRPAREA